MSDYCPKCDGSGWYLLAVPFGHPKFGIGQRCECQAGKPTPRQRKAIERLHQQLGRFAGASFETFTLDRPLSPIDWQVGEEVEHIPVKDQAGYLKAALATCQAFAKAPGGWVYLYGPVGAGKSHLAAATMRRCAERDLIGAYVGVDSLINDLRRGYSDNTYQARLEAMQTLDLLCLDDLMVRHLVEGRTEQTILWQLLGWRYDHALPTVITSNVHPDDLPDQRIASRIAEMTGSQCLWVPVSDYRRPL